jgi:hypothetical protein
VPALTLSPFATLIAAGAPMCCDKGIVTVFGMAKISILLPAEILFSAGCTPPFGNDLATFTS